MNIKATLLAAAVAFVLLSWPQSTAAQAWIGQIAGEAVGREMRALEDQACRNGAPASAQASRIARSAADRLLADYFALHSGSSSRDLWNVFDRRADRAWADTNGFLPVTSLGTRLDEPTPVLGRAVFVVGGDGESARGVWTVTRYGRTTGYYTAVFVHLRSDWSAGSWRIQQFTVWPGDMRPAEPGAYCHLEPSHLWPIPTNFQARYPSPAP